MSSDAEFPFAWPPSVVNKPGVDDAVMYLLEHLAVAEGMINPLDTSMRKDVLSLFVRRALSCPTALNFVIPDGTWVPAQPGSLKPGDIVRVHGDAFDGDLARIHNHRVGEVLWAEGGDVVVASRDGKEPALTGTYYPPYILDLLHPRQLGGEQ